MGRDGKTRSGRPSRDDRFERGLPRADAAANAGGVDVAQTRQCRIGQDAEVLSRPRHPTYFFEGVDRGVDVPLPHLNRRPRPPSGRYACFKRLGEWTMMDDVKGLLEELAKKAASPVLPISARARNSFRPRHRDARRDRRIQIESTACLFHAPAPLSSLEAGVSPGIS